MQVEPLYGRSFLAHNLQAGDAVPVGGSRFTDKLDLCFTADPRKFDEKVERLQAARIDMASPALKDWLARVSKTAEVPDAELFATLQAVTLGIEPLLMAQTNWQARLGLYADKSAPPLLSEILQKGSGQCAELAAVAQYWLQKMGVETYYMTGERAGTQDDFGEPHSFLVVRHRGRTFIYDPSNPVRMNAQPLASLYAAPENYLDLVRQPQESMVPVTHALTGIEAEYGSNDGGNLLHRFAHLRREDDGPDVGRTGNVNPGR